MQFKYSASKTPKAKENCVAKSSYVQPSLILLVVAQVCKVELHNTFLSHNRTKRLVRIVVNVSWALVLDHFLAFFLEAANGLHG